MIDAYTIGITLALNNGVSEGVAAIRRDLEALDRAVDASAAGLAHLRQAAEATVAGAAADIARLMEATRRAAAQLPRSPVPEPAPARDVAPEPSASPAASPPPPPGPVPTRQHEPAATEAPPTPPPQTDEPGRTAPAPASAPAPHAPNGSAGAAHRPGTRLATGPRSVSTCRATAHGAYCAGFRPCAAACAGGASACRRFETTAANIAGCVAEKFGATRLATAHGAYSGSPSRANLGRHRLRYLGPITVSARALEPRAGDTDPGPARTSCGQSATIRHHSGCVTTPIRASHSNCRIRASALRPVRGSAAAASGEHATATDGASVVYHAREQPLAGAFPAGTNRRRAATSCTGSEPGPELAYSSAAVGCATEAAFGLGSHPCERVPRGAANRPVDGPAP
jgi:outer membrane biosynthesis protein TonB